MEINQIEAFIAVMQAGGFSNAGTILHLSQPAISRRIGLLEHELGITLFERVPGGIALTPSGHVFLPHAQRVLAALRDGREAVRSLDTQELGTIKLAMVGTLASTELTAELLAFRRLYPQVQLHLRTARSAEVSEMVQRGEVQLGIRYFSDPAPDLVSQTIRHEDLVVAGSPQRRFHVNKSLAARDLAGIPWVNFPTGSSGEPFAQVLTRQLQIAGLEHTEFLIVDSLTAQKRLVEADFGVGLLPLSSVQEELRLGTLQVLNIPELQTTVPVVVLHRREGHLNKAARTLLDALLKDEAEPAV
jgi:DNA-binding transcriptional LysR family regulator